MSELKTEAAEEKKDVMSIEVAQEDKLPFPTVAYSNYMLSDAFCKVANPLLGSVFADFEGFGVWLDSTGPMPILTMSAFFNQVKDDGKSRDPESFYAFGCEAGNKNDKDSGIQRIRRFELIAEEGNKFHLSDDAKEMLAPFMHQKVITNKGEVNWDKPGVVTYRASQSAFGFSAPVTYSVVNYIDPIKILREIYGTKANIYIENGANGSPITDLHDVGYQIIPMPVIKNGQPVQSGPEGPFNLYINQVDLENAHEAAVAVGINVQFGPRIVHNK